MPDADSVGSFGADDVLTWVQHRWRWILVLLLVLFLTWRVSGERPKENGRYLLVKDDIPCQVQPENDEGRRWCYIVLDTRSGKLEERVRRMEAPKRRK